MKPLETDYNNKHIGGAGTEWFTTNPSEVERIYRTITSPLP